MIGAENLTKPNIAAAIKDAQQERSARTDVTADAVVRELAYIAVGDISGLFDAQGRLREAHDLAPGVRARIAAIDVVRERTRAVGDTTVEESTVKVRGLGQGAGAGAPDEAPRPPDGAGQCDARGRPGPTTGSRPTAECGRCHARLKRVRGR